MHFHRRARPLCTRSLERSSGAGLYRRANIPQEEKPTTSRFMALNKISGTGTGSTKYLALGQKYPVPLRSTLKPGSQSMFSNNFATGFQEMDQKAAAHGLVPRKVPVLAKPRWFDA